MKPTKRFQRALMASAVALLAFGAASAMAADTPYGSCIGSATNDCVTSTGNMSASIVSSLSINEMHAISFGNFSVKQTGGGDGLATLFLGLDGSRTIANSAKDTITLWNGGGATPGSGTGDPGSQSAGHYTVNGDTTSASQVYISFANNAGNPIDICSPGGNVGGPGNGTYTGALGTCDTYHTGSHVTLTGPTVNAFTVDSFVFNESGSDVYGHYISTAAATSSYATGTPFKPGSGPDTGHDNGTGAPGANGAIDVVVGAVLHTVAGKVPAPGKYTSTYDVMVSY